MWINDGEVVEGVMSENQRQETSADGSVSEQADVTDVPVILVLFLLLLLHS